GILAGSGAATTVAAAHSWLGLFPRLARAALPAAAVLGLPLSTYTAALLANTAVPTWHEARAGLPFVFGAGAGLSAGAAAMMLTPVDKAGAARRLAVGGAIAEVAGKRLMERRLGDAGTPYKSKAPALLHHVAEACIATGTGILLRRGARSRRAAVAAGALLLGGALSARWSVFKAGF